MAPAEAARLARVRLGGLAEVKEDCRESWGLSRIEALLRDITYGLRKLSKSPVFTSTAICVLALSIGDATLFFALVRSVLLAPLPYRSPEELVMNVFSRAMGRLIEVDSDSHVLWVAGCGPEGVSRECRAAKWRLASGRYWKSDWQRTIEIAVLVRQARLRGKSRT